MRHLLPLLALALLLTGQDSCEPTPPKPNPEGGNEFCYGNSYTVAGKVRSVAHEVGVGIDAILMGKPSVDRRATVRVGFGQSYCSGVALGPRVVLSAGHCGYGATTEHIVKLGGYDSKVYKALKHVPHPDYLKYVNSGNVDLEARKSDLMLFVMAEDVPGPYPEGFYDHATQAQKCNGGLAQGWGRHETLCAAGERKEEICETDADCPGSTCSDGVLSLRETKYLTTDWSDPKSLKTRASQLLPGQEAGRACYGDSGGPYYMDVDGALYLAGETSTTMSSDCLTGATHVNVFYFRHWIADTATAEGAPLAFAVSP